MKFVLDNIGIIKKAEIEIKALTVIAGLNDVGKSFVTRTIFSVIKTITESNTQLKIEQFERIQATINQIYQVARPVLVNSPVVLNKLYPPHITNQISTIYSSQYNSPLDKAYIVPLLETYKLEVITALEKIPRTGNVTQNRQIKSATDSINKLMDSILERFYQEDNEEENCRNYFEKVIVKKFFQSQIGSINSELSSITMSEEDNELIKISIGNSVVNSFEIKGVIPFKEATLIESPIILQLSKFINSTLLIQGSPFNRRMVQQRAELQYNIYDLVEKLYLSASTSQNEKFISIFNRIANIIGGRLIFEPAELNFTFVKKNVQKIKSFNMASGVKSFGILQLLLTSGSISSNSILIVDEPEVHLHPKWEVEYARIIIALCELGIPIIVSSHSPYMIEALSKYSDGSPIKERTKFYFGKVSTSDGYSTFDDVSSDLTPIFAALASPFRSMFIK
jgi:predicted ATPase